MEDSNICGLVGVAGNLKVKDENVFKTLLYLDTIRGPHSTGVLKVWRGGMNKGEIIKGVGTPWDLEKTNKSFKTLTSGFCRLYMGHNRWATRGAITEENAHPFRKGKIVGAQNGTVRSMKGINMNTFEVDSEAVFHALDTSEVPDVISNLDSSFALTWWNTDTAELNFIRNSERTLYYTFSVENDALYWASEADMLEYALKKNDVKHKEIIPFEIGVWYRIPLPAINNNLHYELPKFTTRKVSLCQTTTYSSYYIGGASNRRQTNFHDSFGNNYDGYNHFFNRDEVPVSKGVNKGNVFVSLGDSGVLVPDKEIVKPLTVSHAEINPNQKVSPTLYENKKDTTIPFRIIGKVMSPTDEGVHYLAAETMQGIKLNVRVYLPISDFRLEVWGKPGTLVIGTVKRHSCVGGIRWLTIKPKTCKLLYNADTTTKHAREEEDKEESKEDHSSSSDKTRKELFVVGTGRLVSRAGYYALVKDGCFKCADKIEEEDADELQWIKDQDGVQVPLCGHCAESMVLGLKKTK